MVSSTRVFRLLQGYRNRAEADLASLYLTLVKLSQLVIDIPEIIELDINPLLLDEHGAIALDARIKIKSSPLRGSDRLAIRPYPKELEETFTMAGEINCTVLLRPILPTDVEAYQNFLQSLSREDARNRFFCSIHQLPRSELARVTQIDYDREMTIVITPKNSLKEKTILGEIRLVIDPDNQQAIIGMAVSTDFQSQGLGFKLLSKAIHYCRERGTGNIVGNVLAGNLRMLNLAKKLGFKISVPHEGVLDIRLNLNIAKQSEI